MLIGENRVLYTGQIVIQTNSFINNSAEINDLR